MGVTVNWADSEKTIILFHVTSPWTWADYYVATDQSWDMLQTVDHTVDFIVDLSAAKFVPSNAMSNLKSRAVRTHTHKGLAIMVGTNSFMQVVISMMSKIFPPVKANVRLASTLEDAYAIAEQEKKRRTHVAS